VIDLILTFAALVFLSLFVVLFGYLKTRDGVLVLILLLTALLRLIVGSVNIEWGPLPGAEVDAVHYESLATEIAERYSVTGDFSIRAGRDGYASLLAVPYAVGGHNALLPTLVNLIFSLHFVVLVYGACRLLGNRRAARLAAFGAAAYPTLVVYTAVPMREAILVWCLALWLYGTIEYTQRNATLINWRVLVGSALATFLHAGFFALAALLPFVSLIRNRRASSRKHSLLEPSARAFGAALLTILMVLTFMQLAPLLEKAPDDGAEVASVEYINDQRERKSSYGTGYVESVPEGPRFLLAVPALVVHFLLSPTPIDALRIGSPAEAFKALDSTMFLVMLVAGAVAMRRAFRRGSAGAALLIGGTLAALILLFALGTANVGIAIRHRAKFSWLFLMIIALWRPELSRRFSSSLAITSDVSSADSHSINDFGRPLREPAS
jgi:hypothetical protein